MLDTGHSCYGRRGHPLVISGARTVRKLVGDSVLLASNSEYVPVRRLPFVEVPISRSFVTPRGGGDRVHLLFAFAPKVGGNSEKVL